MGKKVSKNKISNKKLLVLSLSLSVVIIFGFITYKMVFQSQETRFSLNAAIVDQLSEHFSNSTFITTATNLLTDAGFNVSYFSYEDVTVPFYKQLVESSYGIIVFRTHAAIRVGEPIVDLFTSEEYDESKYHDYRSNGLLSKAEYLVPLGSSSGKYYFAITPKFIERFGRFSHSIIIAMGCSTLNVSSMAQAFINRNAKAYIGWTNIVLPNDTDHETARFLDMFLRKGKTLATSKEATEVHNYYDPHNDVRVFSEMNFYPTLPSTGELKISDLVAEAENQNIMFGCTVLFACKNDY